MSTLEVPNGPHRGRSASLDSSKMKSRYKKKRPLSSRSSTSSLNDDADEKSTQPVQSRCFHSCCKLPMQKHSSSEYVFDYIRGRIIHRQSHQPVFGSTFKQSNSSPAIRRRVEKPKADEEHDAISQSDVSSEDNIVSADEFINRCIIDSQTPRLKPLQRPSTSSTFRKILQELDPDYSEKVTPEVLELPVTSDRRRCNTMSGWQKPNFSDGHIKILV